MQPSSVFASQISGSHLSHGFEPLKARRIADLQAQIEERLASKQDMLSNLEYVFILQIFATFCEQFYEIFSHCFCNYRKQGEMPSKPTPLILDDQGRTVDVTGKEIQLIHRMPTLKVIQIFFLNYF